MSNATAATTVKTNPVMDVTPKVILANQATTTNPAIPKMPLCHYGQMKGSPVVADLRIKQLDINLLEVGYHVRLDLEDKGELEASINREGLREPLQVYLSEKTETYKVIDGVRRLEILRRLCWPTVPCIIVKADERSAVHLAYTINKVRKDLNPIEEARHLRYMMDRFKYTYEEMYIKGYGTQATIASRLKLLDLAKTVQSMIMKGEITAEHGAHIVKLRTHSEQDRFAQRIVSMDITAKRTEKKIDRYLAKSAIPNDESQAPPANISAHGIPGLFIKDASDMEELADKSIHLIVTSPPYFIGMEFEKSLTFDQHWENVVKVLAECVRVLHEGGILILNLGDIRKFEGKRGKARDVYFRLMGHEYEKVLRQKHVYLQDMIIWRKPIAWSNRQYLNYSDETRHTAYRIADNFETIYIFRKAGERPMTDDPAPHITKEEWLEWVDAVWDIRPGKHTSGHPCEWPEELPARLIKMFSFPGDSVLDPWLGSGTTMKVARDLKRVGFGYEREAKYLPMILTKLGKASATDAPVEVTKNIDVPKSSPHAMHSLALKEVENLDTVNDMQHPIDVEEIKVCEKTVRATINDPVNKTIEPHPESEIPAPIASKTLETESAGTAG